MIYSLKEIASRNLDLLSEQIDWKVHEDLDQMVDRLNSGDKREIEEYNNLRKIFLKLWEDLKDLESHKDDSLYQHNFQVIYLCLLTIWGGDMTTEWPD